MTKSHILVVNTPTWIDVSISQLNNGSKIRPKHGIPISLKDVTLWKKRTQGKLDTLKKTITMTYQFKTDKSIVPEGA